MNTQTATTDQTAPQVRPEPRWLVALRHGPLPYSTLRELVEQEPAADPVHLAVLEAASRGLAIQYEPETATYRLAEGDR